MAEAGGCGRSGHMESAALHGLTHQVLEAGHAGLKLSDGDNDAESLE